MQQQQQQKQEKQQQQQKQVIPQSIPSLPPIEDQDTFSCYRRAPAIYRKYLDYYFQNRRIWAFCQAKRRQDPSRALESSDLLPYIMNPRIPTRLTWNIVSEWGDRKFAGTIMRGVRNDDILNSLQWKYGCHPNTEPYRGFHALQDRESKRRESGFEQFNGMFHVLFN